MHGFNPMTSVIWRSIVELSVSHISLRLLLKLCGIRHGMDINEREDFFEKYSCPSIEVTKAKSEFWH